MEELKNMKIYCEKEKAALSLKKSNKREIKLDICLKDFHCHVYLEHEWSNDIEENVNYRTGHVYC